MGYKLKLIIMCSMLSGALSLFPATVCNNINFANTLSKFAGPSCAAVVQGSTNCFQNTCLQGAAFPSTLSDSQLSCFSQFCGGTTCALNNTQAISNFTNAYNAQQQSQACIYQNRHAAEQAFLNYVQQNSHTPVSVSSGYNDNAAYILVTLLSYAAVSDSNSLIYLPSQNKNVSTYAYRLSDIVVNIATSYYPVKLFGSNYENSMLNANVYTAQNMSSLAAFLKANIPLFRIGSVQGTTLSASQFKPFVFGSDFDKLMQFLYYVYYYGIVGAQAKSLPVFSAGATPLADIFRTTDWSSGNFLQVPEVANLIDQAKSFGLMN